MNRTAKFILIATLAEMSLVAAALIAWKGWTAAGVDPAHPHRGTAFQLVALPVWLAACAAYLVRRLRSDRPRLSDSHRRYINTGLGVAALTMAGLQGIMAYSFATGWTPDRTAFVRLVTVIAGAWMAIQGNNAAKLDPPSGDGAPEPAVWTRMALRMGWGMALAGILLIVCGLAAPQPLLMPVLLVLAVLGVGAEIAYRRATSPGRPVEITGL